MPPDFTRSEKVVVIGSYREGTFVATKILLKCPSKYQDQTLNARV
jgi:cytochrome c-type biogenesis protein CcmE